MQWLPDSGWLRALDLRTSTAAAVALTCWAVLGLAKLDLLYLGELPTWLRAAFAVVALLATALWGVRMWELAHRRWRTGRQRQEILTELDKLSDSEARLLTEQLEKNEQTFSVRFDNPIAAGLRQKGLAVRSDTGHLLGYPHTIPNFVWAELRRRRGGLG